MYLQITFQIPQIHKDFAESYFKRVSFGFIAPLNE